MHSNAPDAYTHIDAILSALDQCDAFAAEFPLDEKEHLHLGEFGLFPEGQSLRDYLTPKQLDRLQRTLWKYLRIDIRFFQRLLPLLLTQIIDEKLLASAQSDRPALDQFLWDYARAQEKSLLGIETHAEQMAILAAIPPKLQVRGLLQLSRNLRAHRQGLLDMVRLYALNDHHRLYLSARRSSGTLRKLLLLQRNAVMADRIAAQARQQPTFFAIGAAHLGGGKGVLRLLKQQGLHVQPCCFTTP